MKKLGLLALCIAALGVVGCSDPCGDYCDKVADCYGTSADDCKEAADALGSDDACDAANDAFVCQKQ